MASAVMVKNFQIARNALRFTASNTRPDINKLIFSSRRKIRSSHQNIFTTLDSHICNQKATNNHVLQLLTVILKVCVFYSQRSLHIKKPMR